MIECSPYHILPDLLPSEYDALKVSIAERGVDVPKVVDQEGNTLDGRHRQRACDELGEDCPTEVRYFASEAEKYEFILRANCRRRQLSRKQRERLIEVYLLRDPQIADNHLGTLIGVSKNTVAKARAHLEATRQIDKFDKLRGRDGKDRSTKYKRIVASTAEEVKNALEAIRHLPGKCEEKPLDVVTPQYVTRESNGGESPTESPAVSLVLPVADRAALLRAGKQSPAHGIIYTPSHVAQFLATLLSPLRPKTVLDAGSGNGALSLPWRESANVIEYELGFGRDFFDCDDHIDADLALCNAPFGEEKEFLHRIIEVVPASTPIALFVTHRVRLGSYATSDDWQWCRDEWPPITSIVSLPRGTFKGVNETVEILLFRAPHLLPHYFLSDLSSDGCPHLTPHEDAIVKNFVRGCGGLEQALHGLRVYAEAELDRESTHAAR